MNDAAGKRVLKDPKNRRRDMLLSPSGVAHQVDEYYLKKDVDKYIEGIKNKRKRNGKKRKMVAEITFGCFIGIIVSVATVYILLVCGG